MNPTAIYSKSGKGVQEASGATSLLPRADRAVLSAIDGRASLGEVAQKVGRTFDPVFLKLIDQLDKDGFIREVAGIGSPAGAAKPAGPSSRPGQKPAGPPSDFGDLDFSSLGATKQQAWAPSRPVSPSSRAVSPPSRPVSPPSRPVSPPSRPVPPPSRAVSPPSRSVSPPSRSAPSPSPAAAKAQTDALAKAREEAEARAAAERERVRLETEAKAKAAREAALKLAEAKLKAEQEAQAKIEAERKAREEMERRLEQERKAREEAERKAREGAERAQKQLEEERKAREEAERKAKEEAERLRRELEEERRRIEAERKREEAEEAERQARRKKEEEQAAALLAAAEARKAQPKEPESFGDALLPDLDLLASRDEEQRKAKEEAERPARHKKEEEQAAALLAAAEARKAQPKAPDSFGDALVADLDLFSTRDDEERKAKEEGERKASEEAEQRTREEAQRLASERAERQRREEEEERRMEEVARRAREDDERRAHEQERRVQEEERRRREAEEIRRKATAATAAAMAKEGKGAPASEYEVSITDDDLDMRPVKRAKAAPSRTPAKYKEREEERDEAADTPERRASAEPRRPRMPVKRGRLIGTTLVVLIVGALIAIHVVPVPVAAYERAATEALGRPVKIGEAKFWLLTGPQIRFSNVRIGGAVIPELAAGIAPASLFSERKEFTRVDIDRLTLPQESLGEALFATVKADSLAVERIVVKRLQLAGPAVMPKELQADVQLNGRGALRAATVHGPDGLVAKITPKGSSVEFDVLAAGFTLPIAPEITLSKFGMKGSANRRGMRIDEWGGALFNGGISGTASIRWGATWAVEGVLTVRGMNAAVFAPALVSKGTGEGTARFSMSATDPAKLAATGRLDGNFSISQGTLGSYDLARAIQTGGRSASGTTPFTEMTGQAVYDRGAVSLRNVSIAAGALNAGASADIMEGGALSGRIVADIKNAGRFQQATIVLGGTVKEPQVRN